MLSVKSLDFSRRLGSVGAISVLVTVLGGLLLAAPFALNQFWGLRLYPVLDQSMAPSLHQGDLLVSLPKPTTQLQPGEIIVTPVLGQDHLQAHRIVSVQQDVDEIDIVTKADASVAIDLGQIRLESASDVQVKVGAIAFLGSPLDFLQRNRLLAPPLFMGILFFILSLLKTMSRRPQKPTFPRPPYVHPEIRVPRLDDPLNHFVTRPPSL